MKPEDPTDPHAWMLRAKSNLSLAEKGGRLKGVLLEDLCFNAQQSAEKPLKLVCLAKGLDFPRTHSVVRLVDILEAGGIPVPDKVREAVCRHIMLCSHAIQVGQKKLPKRNTGKRLNLLPGWFFGQNL
jgi:HEPN domain-containing protein